MMNEFFLSFQHSQCDIYGQSLYADCSYAFPFRVQTIDVVPVRMTDIELVNGIINAFTFDCPLQNITFNGIYSSETLNIKPVLQLLTYRNTPLKSLTPRCQIRFPLIY